MEHPKPCHFFLCSTVAGNNYELKRHKDHQNNDDYVRAYTNHIFDIPDNLNKVKIRIQLWDEDVAFDDKYDISRNGHSLDLHFNTHTGLWTGEDGEDSAGEDTNGVGFSRGSLGGSDNGAIWFDIYMTGDSDNDGLSHKAEEHWGTDPDDANTDGDSAGLDDRFEVIYQFFSGIDPTNPNDDLDADEDDDGIKLKDEYKFGGIPGQKDIFLEVDWLKSEYKMSEDDLYAVTYPFAKRGIALHIDDNGESSQTVKYMGGGQNINQDWFVGFGIADETDFYVPQWSIFIDPVSVPTSVERMYGDQDYFSSDRQDVFRYVLLGGYPGYDKENSPTQYPLGKAATEDDFFAVWKKSIFDNTFMDTDWCRSVFMHELGHTIGLGADYIYANSNLDPISDSNYPSAMRYGRYSWDDGFIDFSNKGIETEVLYAWDGDEDEVYQLKTNDWLNLDLENFST